jgi:hypothetical protein
MVNEDRNDQDDYHENNAYHGAKCNGLRGNKQWRTRFFSP